MKMTRLELNEAIAALANWVPEMLANTEPHSHMDAYACHVEAIEDRVADEDHDHYWSATQCILRDNGLIPGDDEPCDTGLS